MVADRSKSINPSLTAWGLDGPRSLVALSLHLSHRIVWWYVQEEPLIRSAILIAAIEAPEKIRDLKVSFGGTPHSAGCMTSPGHAHGNTEARPRLGWIVISWVPHTGSPEPAIPYP